MPDNQPGRIPRGRAPSLALLATLLLAVPALAAVPYPNVAAAASAAKATWYRQCQQVRYRRPPPQDLPRALAAGRCDATALYYGTLAMAAPNDADWQAVRECAFRTGDNAVLMMLYANGDGVAPNLGLAMKYACSTGGSPADMKIRLARLTQGSAHTRFDQCDGAGGKPGICASVQQRQENKQRGDELAALARGWTAKERLGFDMALQAARYFAQHRHDYETDLSGSAHSRLQAEAEAAELELFAGDIQDFEQGKVPHLGEAEYAVLDQKMNLAYKEFMDSAPAPDAYLGTIRKQDVEKTQRAWLAYRDAVELFGSIKYPDVPAAGWRALLTSRRLRQLTELENAELGK